MPGVTPFCLKQDHPLYAFDQKQSNGGALVVGVDEAGRGPLAGPVVAAAVLLPDDFYSPDLNDSKKISEKKRNALFERITHEAYWGLASVNQSLIDKINILEAARQAMRTAWAQLQRRVTFDRYVLLVDGWAVPHLSDKQVPVIKGDAKSAAIAAASILAKVARDRMMVAFDKQFPQYGFAQHKGYGAKTHLEAILSYGPCAIHRKTFSPICDRFSNNAQDN